MVKMEYQSGVIPSRIVLRIRSEVGTYLSAKIIIIKAVEAIGMVDY